MDNISRSQWAVRMGLSHDGLRDTFEAAGYKKTLNVFDFLGKEQRQDVAERLIEIFPSEAWRIPPKILDGVDEKEAKDDTPFVKAWNAIANPPPNFDVVDDQKSIWAYLQRADSLSLIGRYGVLFIGVSGADSLSESLSKNRRFAYARPFDESRANFTDMDLETDTSSPRFGMPKFYHMNFTDGIREKVHWSRCIHISHKPKTNDAIGTPMLESVWNRLDDIDQTMAGSKEAFWKYVGKTIIFEQLPDYESGDAMTTEQLERFVHGAERMLELEGYKANALSGENVDPSAMIDAALTLISVAKSIPKRKLMGSERGELASTQDDDNWLDTVRSWQTHHAQPNILEPFINRLLYCGALPRPTSGNYFIKWPSLAETKPSEDAEIFKGVAEGFKHLNESEADRFVSVPSLVNTYLPTLDPSSINEEVLPKSIQPEMSANVRGNAIPPLPFRVELGDDDAISTSRAWNNAETGYDDILNAVTK